MVEARHALGLSSQLLGAVSSRTKILLCPEGKVEILVSKNLSLIFVCDLLALLVFNPSDVYSETHTN